MKPAVLDADLAWIDGLTSLKSTLRRLLREVRLSLETVFLSGDDREDVVECFRQFVRELSRPQPDPDRLTRYWNRVNELAPTAAHTLARSEEISQHSMRWGEGIEPRGGFLNEEGAATFVESVTDPATRRVLESAYRAMVEMSAREGVRPEGAFDLLYFYRLLAKLAPENKL